MDSSPADSPPDSALASCSSGSRLSTSTTGLRSGRKLKRHRTIGEPPQVGHRICVGDHAVPYQIEDLGSRTAIVIDIHGEGGGRRLPWLMHAIGWSALPIDCVVKDLRDAVNFSRTKRSTSLWKGGDGRRTIDATVRGKIITLMNDKRLIRLVVDVDEDPDTGEKTYPTLQWFITELYNDLHAADSDSEQSKSQGDNLPDEYPSDSGSAAEDAATGGPLSEPAAESLDELAHKRLQARIESLCATDGKTRWAPSRHSFQAKLKPDDTHYKEWRIPQKCMGDPASCVKWLVATRKAIAKSQETGEFTKATLDDLGATDDEL